MCVCVNIYIYIYIARKIEHQMEPIFRKLWSLMATMLTRMIALLILTTKY